MIIPCNGTWVFQTCGGTTNFDTWLFLGTTCCDGSLANNNNFCSSQDRVTLTSILAGNYYAEVEGWGTSVAGNYTLTVYEITPPAITCPANQSVNSSPGLCSAAASFTTPVSSDNCTTNPTEALTSGLASGSTFPVGTTTNVFTSTDNSSNTASCSFTITVSDVENPAITCPPNITVSTGPTSCNAVVTYTAPAGTDNCAGTTTALSSGTGSGGTFPAGASNEVYTATDASGNTASCNFTVTVVDGVAPAINCPANITANNDPGNCVNLVNYTTPSVSDNCPNPVTAHIAGLGSGSNFPVGITQEAWVVTDGAGNTDTCSFDVIIIDNEVPVISGCPLNQFITASDSSDCDPVVSWIATTAIDNCPGLIFSESDTSGTEFPVGTTSVLIVAADSSGNADTCSFNVIVQALPFSGGAIVQQDETCLNSNDGIACAEPKGGCTPYIFNWSTTATTLCASGLGAGSYILTMTDGQGFTITDTVSIALSAGLIPPVFQSNDTLCTNPFYTTYQWLDAIGNPVSGAIFNCFVPGGSGTFSVQVTDTNGCTGTSGPFNYVGYEDGLFSGWLVYPNPGNGNFRLGPRNPVAGPVEIEIIDPQGRMVKRILHPGTIDRNLEITIPSASSGIYMVILKSGEQQFAQKIVVTEQ